MLDGIAERRKMGFFILISVSLISIMASCARSAGAADKVRDFDDYPLVWVGESYDVQGDAQGPLPIRAAKYYRSGPGAFHPSVEFFDIQYGTCDIPPGQRGCPVPVTIEVYDPCTTPELAEAARFDTTEVRGVDAVVTSSGRLWVETADFTVSIGVAIPGIDPVKGASQVANALVGANDAATGFSANTNFTPKPDDFEQTHC